MSEIKIAVTEENFSQKTPLTIGLIAQKEVDAVFFFRDSLDKHPHEPDVQMLMRLWDVHNIPLAPNLAGANLFLSGLLATKKSST
jgi:Methylglyoxal synthase